MQKHIHTPSNLLPLLSHYTLSLYTRTYILQVDNQLPDPIAAVVLSQTPARFQQPVTRLHMRRNVRLVWTRKGWLSAIDIYWHLFIYLIFVFSLFSLSLFLWKHLTLSPFLTHTQAYVRTYTHRQLLCLSPLVIQPLTVSSHPPSSSPSSSSPKTHTQSVLHFMSQLCILKFDFRTPTIIFIFGIWCFLSPSQSHIHTLNLCLSFSPPRRTSSPPLPHPHPHSDTLPSSSCTPSQNILSTPDLESYDTFELIVQELDLKLEQQTVLASWDFLKDFLQGRHTNEGESCYCYLHFILITLFCSILFHLFYSVVFCFISFC